MLLLVVQKGWDGRSSGMMVVVPGSCIRLMQYAVLGLFAAELEDLSGPVHSLR